MNTFLAIILKYFLMLQVCCKCLNFPWFSPVILILSVMYSMINRTVTVQSRGDFNE